MPNYVMHNVTIKGSVETISKVTNQIINTKDNNGDVVPFSFQTIIPRPVSLDIPSSSEVERGIDYLNGDEAVRMKIKEQYATYPDGENRLKECIRLGEIALDNIKKYGHKDWYDWNRANWGTKWDAYEPYVNAMTDEIFLSFMTAWSTPEHIFKKLAEQYPDLLIEIEYADEDLGSNCGSYSYVDGKWDYNIGNLEFACQMWDVDPEEYMEENG